MSSLDGCKQLRNDIVQEQNVQEHDGPGDEGLLPLEVQCVQLQYESQFE